MDLYYKSTRNSNLKVTASEAILKGLAPDGGLFVPEKLPVLGKSIKIVRIDEHRRENAAKRSYNKSLPQLFHTQSVRKAKRRKRY